MNARIRGIILPALVIILMIVLMFAGPSCTRKRDPGPTVLDQPVIQEGTVTFRINMDLSGAERVVKLNQYKVPNEFVIYLSITGTGIARIVKDKVVTQYNSNTEMDVDIPTGKARKVGVLALLKEYTSSVSRLGTATVWTGTSDNFDVLMDPGQMGQTLTVSVDTNKKERVRLVRLTGFAFNSSNTLLSGGSIGFLHKDTGAVIQETTSADGLFDEILPASETFQAVINNVEFTAEHSVKSDRLVDVSHIRYGDSASTLSWLTNTEARTTYVSLLTAYSSRIFDNQTGSKGIFYRDEIYRYGTNPFLSDTDSDNYADKDEINGSADPNDGASSPATTTTAFKHIHPLIHAGLNVFSNTNGYFMDVFPGGFSSGLTGTSYTGHATVR